MPTGSPLVRQWTLIRLLAARHYGATLAEMAAEAGVSQKTIRRDLENFRRAGLPLEEVAGDFNRKTWKIRPDGIGLSFTFDEALALYLGRRLLEPLAGTYFHDAAGRAFCKVRVALGEPALQYLDTLAGVVHPILAGGQRYAGKGEIVDDLHRAAEDCKQAIILYRSARATEAVEHEVHPYNIVIRKDALYLIGYSRDQALSTSRRRRVDQGNGGCFDP